MELLYLLSEGAEGPDTSLAWIFYLGLGIFFLTIAIGWISSSREQDEH